MEGQDDPGGTPVSQFIWIGQLQVQWESFKKIMWKVIRKAGLSTSDLCTYTWECVLVNTPHTHEYIILDQDWLGVTWKYKKADNHLQKHNCSFNQDKLKGWGLSFQEETMRVWHVGLWELWGVKETICRPFPLQCVRGWEPASLIFGSPYRMLPEVLSVKSVFLSGISQPTQGF